MGLRHLTKKGDYMFSFFDLKDGFYPLGTAQTDRDFFTVDIRGTLYRLAGLPMGWSLSPYYFITSTEVVVRHMRTPELEPAPAASAPNPLQALHYVDDFLLFANTEAAALAVRARMLRVREALGRERHAEKGFWEPARSGASTAWTSTSTQRRGYFSPRRPRC
eukprot:jgi/Tetstr1/448976/TSEL_036201.t1